MSESIRFCLRVSSKSAMVGSAPIDICYPLQLGTWQIGSDPSTWLYLNEPYVLPQHIEIACNIENCQVTYLGPENGPGAFLNDSQSSMPTGIALPLRIGDKIRLGFTQLFLEEMVEEQAMNALLPAALSFFNAPAKQRPYQGEYPPGLHYLSVRLLQKLPEIYQPSFAQSANNFLPDSYHPDLETFLSRFLGLFESVLIPLAWQVENFDFYLDVRTSPEGFILWLQQWYDLTFDETWSKAQRDKLLIHAHKLFELRGSLWAIRFLVETYTDAVVEIDESDSIGSHTFRLTLNGGRSDLPQDKLVQWINMFKPAHTKCLLEWRQQTQ